MVDQSDKWYEETIRGLEITLDNKKLIDDLWEEKDKDNRLFKDKTSFAFFSLVLAIYKGKEPDFYDRKKAYELRSEWGTTDIREMGLKLVQHKFPKPVNKMDPKKIGLKCISSLVQQGLTIIEERLRTDRSWDRLGEEFLHEKFFETLNNDYQ